MGESTSNFPVGTEEDLFAKKIYDKRFNILFHGFEENRKSVWENKFKYEVKFRKFLRFVFKIPEIHFIAIADIHCLSQHPISKNGVRIMQPILLS